MKTLNHIRLLEVLDYNPSTGIFNWKIKGRGITQGKIAGAIRKKDNYVIIKIDQQSYLGHILAWFYVHGVWPSFELDHKNRIRYYNAIDNLRPSTRSLNNFNINPRPNNKLGLKGVCQVGKRFKATITPNGVCHRLGIFDDPIEAAKAYDQAALNLIGIEATTNKSLGLIV